MTKESDLIIKIIRLEDEVTDLKIEAAAFKKEISDFKEWKAKCDRVALKWGSFAMGILTLGAILVTGADKMWDKVSGILSLWVGR